MCPLGANLTTLPGLHIKGIDVSPPPPCGPGADTETVTSPLDCGAVNRVLKNSALICPHKRREVNKCTLNK